MMPSPSVTLEIQDGLALISIDAPPVNTLSLSLVEQMRQHLQTLHEGQDWRALLVRGVGRNFAAGADVSEFSKSDFDPRSFGLLMNEIEALDRPVVALLQGHVLGAGLELAMACHWRIAARGTRLGLPEVQLGVLPGAGGTQRLPRLVGLECALDLIMSGRQIDEGQALKLGLVDWVTDHDLAAAGRSIVSQADGPRRTCDRLVSFDGDSDKLEQAHRRAQTEKSQYPAMQRIVQCLQAAVELPFTDGLTLERKLFEECRQSQASMALRHLFFARRLASRIPGLPESVAARAINRVGVVGAGTMGAGITMNFLNAGIPTLLVDSGAEALERGKNRIRNDYELSASKGKISQAAVEQRLSLLESTLEIGKLADCDLVIEAVFENMQVKLDVCEQMGRVCKPGAILASNTSTLNVDELAAASGRPSDFLGLHFFSPANVMKLLEVVRGARTSDEVLGTSMRLAKMIDKVAVVSGVCYGFIGNRMLESYLREADFLLMEGASPAKVDRALESLGFAMGPCRMLDLAGTDVAGKIVLEQGKAGRLPNDASYRAPVVRLLELGRHGQKAGRGYYRYEGRNAQLDPEFSQICLDLAKQHGIAQRKDISDAEIVQRCLYPLINEGARIIEESIAYRASDIDVVWTNGYGFPDYRGGPLFMADQIGLGNIVNVMKTYAASDGDPFGYWEISPLLEMLAQQGGRLSDQHAPLYRSDR